jgi:hypothetical protein
MKCRHILLGTVLLCSAAFAQSGWKLEMASAPWLPRDMHGAAVFKGQVWLVNGEPFRRDAWTLSSDGITWHLQVENMPWHSKSRFAILDFQDRLWVLGGRSNYTGYTNDVWSSPTGFSDWKLEVGAANWRPRRGHTAAVFKDRMWILGGVTRESGYRFELNDVWSTSDGLNWELEVAAASWAPRNGHTTVVFNERLWVIGGGSSDVWSSENGETWRLETSSAPWGVRGAHASAVFKDRIWVIGGIVWKSGYIYAMNSADVWSSVNGVNWVLETAEAPWTGSGRAFHASIPFRNRLFVLGGDDGVTGFINDVWSLGLFIAPDGLPNTTEGKYGYRAELQARVGLPPYSWTLLDGELPPGLEFDGDAGDRIAIIGRPTQAGEYSFTIQLEDGEGDKATQTYTIRVRNPAEPKGSAFPFGTGCAAAAGWGGWVVAAGGPALALAAFLTIQALRPRRPRPRPKARRGSPRPRTR